MRTKKGTEMAKPLVPEYQDISDDDSDQDVHMYSGPMREEPRSVDAADSAISSCSGSPLTPSSVCPFLDPASRFNGRNPEITRPSVIVASPDLERSHGSPSSGHRLPLPPPNGVTCEIVTQPKQLMRFRYSSEYKDNRTAHKMVGQDSTTDRTTYPSLLIKGWNGPAVVVVSLVQDENYKQLHPHSLVPADCDKDSVQDGFVRRPVNCSSAGTLVQFKDLCLIRNKKESVVKRLPQLYRQIDPFGVGYQSSDTRSINSHAVRLCFEVYMYVQPGYFRLPPVVSWVVRNSGAHQTLKILNLGFCPSRDNNLQEVMLLCDKVDKDDIEVEVVALEMGKENILQSHRNCDVHGQVAIIFKLLSVILAKDNIYVRLKRISTQDKSELFKLTPLRPVREHVAGTPTTSPGGTLSTCPHQAAFDISHLTSREPIIVASSPDDYHRYTYSHRSAKTNSSTIEPETSAYSNTRNFENFSTKVHHKKKITPKESSTDIFNDVIRLNGLSINTSCQANGHVNYAESTKETAYTNYIPNIHLTADPLQAVVNIDDDKANESSENISNLFSDETLKIVEKDGLNGVDENTIYDVFDHANEEKMST